jgi:hypothetical protein
MKNKRKKRQRRPWHGVWGRKPKRAAQSGIKPDEEIFDEIRGRLLYGPEWRMVALQSLIPKDRSQLHSNYLSAPRDTRCSPYTEQHPGVFQLWKDLCFEFERAVVNGDADWFERQAKAIKKGGLQQRARFNEKVVHLFDTAMCEPWRPLTDAERKALPEAFSNLRRVPQVVTLTPAGKSTDATASKIYDALEKRSVWIKKGRGEVEHIIAEGYQFESKKRVMDAIRELAKLLRFTIKKQQRRVSDASEN